VTNGCVVLQEHRSPRLHGASVIIQGGQGGKEATVVIDDEGGSGGAYVGGIRTFEPVTSRNAAMAGHIDVSPPSPCRLGSCSWAVGDSNA
jgi:hypothetical protein